MKISVNWLKEYLKFDFTIDELTDKIGAQLGEIEGVVHLGKKYEGIVIAKVVSCEPHPDADRLKICMIDDKKVVSGVARNKDGLVQVVCGAPNARAGMLAAWIPPGVTVPVTHSREPLILEAREIRGKTSNGMLASEHELELSDDHEGILEINEKGKAGQSFAEAYKLDDYIIDIENKMFTHRPDCFGLLGVAREVAGIFNKPFVSPGWYKNERKNLKQPSAKDSIKVANDLPELVPRFMLQVIENVKVTESPTDLQCAYKKLA